MSELDLTFKSKKLILAENLQQGGGRFWEGSHTFKTKQHTLKTNSTKNSDPAAQPCPSLADDGQEHQPKSSRNKMPRQGRTGHVPVSRCYLCHEQKRCQWADFLEETVHGMCQASAGAACCTAAEGSSAAAAERFRWRRLSYLADSNWTGQSRETNQVDWSGQGVRRRCISGGDRLHHEARRWRHKKVPPVERRHRQRVPMSALRPQRVAAQPGRVLRLRPVRPDASMHRLLPVRRSSVRVVSA